MNGEAFATDVKTQLAPALHPGTVIIPDNLSTHRNTRAAQAFKDRGCWFLYLPPYSPDLNPIEMALAKLKQLLRGVVARTFDHFLKALGDICDLFTPEECSNDLRHAGYAST